MALREQSQKLPEILTDNQKKGTFYVKLKKHTNLKKCPMNILESILQQMSGISQSQKKFMVILFSTILLVYGKVNFTNLSRYSSLSEKTYRRHFLKKFSFSEFHQCFIKKALNSQRTIIAAIDCSFINKSGKKTEGKATFYNGVAGRPEEGLEISVISLVEVETHLSYSVSVQQTPWRPPTELPKTPLTPKGKKTSKKQTKKEAVKSSTPELTRVDDYAKHLKETRFILPESVRYLVADGYYCRAKFWDAVGDLNLHLISKLRSDANLNYIYTGEKNKIGAPRKYDGKVDCNKLKNLTFIKEIKPGVKLYSLVVWSVCLKCQIRLACLQEVQPNGKIKNILLFSTDLDLTGEQILEYYRARFQIEFIFRDAKQFTGLSDCQSCSGQRLDFHFNASLIALNLAKYEAYNRHSSPDTFVFSMASYKRLEFNRHILYTFIDKLDLDPNLILNHPNLPSVLSYGTLAA
ncbi:transposase [Microcoleus sp. K5-D4]|uniref:transposase n=1 Tax=Microcoleus sp. K5-D4 TaxID=2818801 RepID=UPI002FD72742